MAIALGSCGFGGSTAAPSPSDLASHNGLQLSIDLDSNVIEPGGTLVVTATVHNGRKVPVTYPGLYGLRMQIYLPLPLEPIGKQWPGTEGEFKFLALGGDEERGSSQESVPFDQNPDGYDPFANPLDNATLVSGQTLTAKFTWKAEFAPGLPAEPGKVSLRVAFQHDVAVFPAPQASSEGDLPFLMRGEDFEIAGTRPPMLSRGQAVDAALSNVEYDAWLREQPESTWTNVNLYLDPDRGWAVELVRRAPSDPTRSVGFAYVDAHTGTVSLHICRAPCAI